MSDVRGLTEQSTVINAVDLPGKSFTAECDWRILSGRGWREDRSWRENQKRNEDVMIQSLVKNPTSICVDSGAGESVCPAEAFPDYET